MYVLNKNDKSLNYACGYNYINVILSTVIVNAINNFILPRDESFEIRLLIRF